MSEPDFRRAYFFSMLSFMFLVGGESFSEELVWLQVVMVVFAVGLSLVGCHQYAQAKGLPRARALFGLVPLFGFWVVLCLEGGASQKGRA